MPSSSLAGLHRTLLCWGVQGDDDDNDDGPRGDDHANGVQPHLPNTQQAAIAGGEGGNNKDDKEEREVGKER